MGTQFGIPVNSIHRDNAFYPEADRVDGFRFYKLRQQGYQGVNTTDISTTYLSFGYGPRAWYVTLLLKIATYEADELIALRHSPGRWMAEVLMKLVFAHVLLDYDISLPGEVKHPLRERWSFEELYIPRVDAKIVLRPRPQEQKV